MGADFQGFSAHVFKQEQVGLQITIKSRLPVRIRQYPKRSRRIRMRRLVCYGGDCFCFSMLNRLPRLLLLCIAKVSSARRHKNAPPEHFYLRISLRLILGNACSSPAVHTLLVKKLEGETLPLIFLYGGDCWTRTSDLLHVKQTL